MEDPRTVFRYNQAEGITSLDPAFARNLENMWACDQIFDREAVARSWYGFRGSDEGSALGLWALAVFEGWRREWGIEQMSGVDECGY